MKLDIKDEENHDCFGISEKPNFIGAELHVKYSNKTSSDGAMKISFHQGIGSLNPGHVTLKFRSYVRLWKLNQMQKYHQKC